MRIISGKFKGKKLLSSKGFVTRPTSDRAKESVFNILNTYIKFNDIFVIDVFAGSGAFGIECLSRGAKKCLFVEKDAEAISFIKKNLTNIKMLENAEFLKDYQEIIRCKDVPQIIFMDPPYNQGLIEKTLEILNNSSVLRDETIIITECDKEEKFEIPKNLVAIDTRSYGKAKFTFLKKSSEG